MTGEGRVRHLARCIAFTTSHAMLGNNNIDIKNPSQKQALCPDLIMAIGLRLPRQGGTVARRVRGWCLIDPGCIRIMKAACACQQSGAGPRPGSGLTGGACCRATQDPHPWIP